MKLIAIPRHRESGPHQVRPICGSAVALDQRPPHDPVGRWRRRPADEHWRDAEQADSYDKAVSEGWPDRP